MTLDRRAWLISRALALILLLVSFGVVYWQLLRGVSLQPVALDPVTAAREYARLRGDPTPEPGSEPAQVGMMEGLALVPQPVVQRTVNLLSKITRGTIYDSAGNVLAEDRITQDGERIRYYADPSLAHTIGYVSALRTGAMGLEAAYNDELLGLNRPDTEIARLLHQPIRGSDLVLTIDPRVQQAAVEALGGRAGAVVAVDARTGAVLAIVSSPTYDPNRAGDAGYLSSLGGGALINRATQGLYTPGSTWKTLTLIAAYDSGQVNAGTVIDFGQPQVDPSGRTCYYYEVDGGRIPDCSHRESRLDVSTAYVYSANAAFAKLADEMDPSLYIEYAQRFGFSDPNYHRRFPLELAAALPQAANDLDSLRTNNLLRASTGFGQGELLATPIQMAMMAQAVVNDGVIKLPYFVESVRDPEGRVISTRPNSRTVQGLMRVRTAQFVKEAMAGLINRYYGGANFIPGAAAGGKTGTAQLGGDLEPHAWFIGFAENEYRRVAIAVVVEHGGAGSDVAVPIFRQVAAAATSQE